MKDYLDPTGLSMVLYECIREKIRTDGLSQSGVSDTEDRKWGLKRPPLIHFLSFEYIIKTK